MRLFLSVLLVVLIRSVRLYFWYFHYLWKKLHIQCQQIGQLDAPPRGSFGAWFFIKVWWLRFAFVSGAHRNVKQIMHDYL